MSRQARNIEDSLGRFAKQIGEGRTGEAERLARRLVQQAPNLAAAHNAAGVAAYLTGRQEAAEAALARAIELDPLAAEYHSNLGSVYKAQSRLARAEAAYRRCLALYPEGREKALFNLGSVLFALERDEEAADCFRQALTLVPGYAKALNELGLVLRHLGSRKADRALLEESLACYRRLAAVVPGFPNLRHSTGQACLEMARTNLDAGEDEAALAWCRDGVEKMAGSVPECLEIVTRAPSGWRRDVPLEMPVLENVRILPGDKEWFVLDAEGRLHIDGLANANPEVGSYVRIEGRGGRAIVERPARALDLGETEAILLGGSGNYFHWMLDYLPRFEVLERHPAFAGWPLLVNETLSPFQRQCLEHLAISENRLIRLPAPAAVHCRRVAVPMIASLGTEFHPASLRWLRETFAPRGGDGKAARRLYLSRRDAGIRRVVDEAEVEGALLGLGFEILVPGTLGVREQAAAFADASTIVGPHGAGLANVVFAPPGTNVIELVVGQRQTPHYYASLAAACGHRFHRLACHPSPSPVQKTTLHEQDFDMRVPVAKLMAAIAAAEGSG